MAKRIIWTCDICGDTVPNDGPIHQIRFLKCKVENEYLEGIHEDECYQVCNNCVKKVHAIFTDYLRSEADSSKKAIEDYKKKGSKFATC